LSHDAWGEVVESVGTAPNAVETTRLSLAEIVLSLAKTQPIERACLKDAAVRAFRVKHGLP
jgi:hypothetical protein